MLQGSVDSTLVGEVVVSCGLRADDFEGLGLLPRSVPRIPRNKPGSPGSCWSSWLAAHQYRKLAKKGAASAVVLSGHQHKRSK